MTEINNLTQLMQNWYREVGCYIIDCPPEAKVISGRQAEDGMYHQFEKDSGILLTLSENLTLIDTYEIIDEHQFTLFALRYS